jgi:hypothetical protein
VSTEAIAPTDQGIVSEGEGADGPRTAAEAPLLGFAVAQTQT